MRSKKKIYDRIEFQFPDDFEKDSEGDTSAVYDRMKKLNLCSDAIQQILFLKEFHKTFLSAKLHLGKYCAVLTHLFYQCPINSPQKKTLCRIFLELYEKEDPSCILNSLQHGLHLSLGTLLDDVDSNRTQIVDCILGLLDNFILGPSVIVKEFEYVWNSLRKVALRHDHPINFECIETNNALQAFMKTIIYILQKCENVKYLMNCSEMCKSASDGLQTCVELVLKRDATHLNCRLNAGIAYCYFKYDTLESFEEKFLFKGLYEEGRLEILELFHSPAQLCILSGIMAVVSLSEFFEGGLLAEIIMDKIIYFSESMEDTDLLLLCTRNLIQWTNLMSNVFKSEKDLPIHIISTVKKIFAREGGKMDILFDYVLNFREHYIDTLRHLSRDLFMNLLNLHLLSIYVEPCESAWIKKITIFLLAELPDYRSGKYGLLSCIVNIIGTDIALQWFPSLPDSLYKVLGESNLISHVSSLLETLYRKHVGPDENFQNIWLAPLMKYLSLDSKDYISSINEHLLPKLFKVRPTSIQYLLNELTKMWEQNKGHCFSVLITCIKLHQREKVHKSVLECIPKTSLEKAFCHASDQVRLSAFNLICENQKTTEPISSEYFELIKFGLLYNISCQSPSFRQQLVASLKKFFSRMKDSSYTLERNSSDRKEVANSSSLLHPYKDFIKWIIDYLLKSLCPGANFPRRVTALNILHLVHSMFPDYFLDDFHLTFPTLFFTLQDTYENNKQLALNILLSLISSEQFKQDDGFLLKSFNAALILSSSTKPPDTVTAAYIFSFIVNWKSFNALALKHVSIQIIKGMCLLPSEKLIDILFEEVNSGPLRAILLLSGELLRHLKLAQKSLLDASAHAPMYGILTCIRKIISQVNFRLVAQSKSSQLWRSVIYELLRLCSQVSKVVEPVVCNSSPEGYLPMETSSDSIMKLQAAVRKAIGQRFSSAVIKENDLDTDAENVTLDVVKTHAVTAQILLLCCWRTHKEISLLFGEYCEKIPIAVDEDDSEDDDDSDDSEGDGSEDDDYSEDDDDSEDVDDNKGLLYVSEVSQIGQYFIRQMISVKHRGAFEQAFVGFEKLCRRLWRSTNKDLQKLPKDWLMCVIYAIKGLNKALHLSPTRRSGGLPFVVQAIITSIPDLSHSDFVKNTISAFLNLNYFQRGTDEEIHALNILRALFRDASLSEAVVPLVSRALMVAIAGFDSESWAARNSSTLLFSALMTRIFGVSKGNDESEKKCRLTGKTFFTYYKDTYPFFEEELEKAASVLDANPYSISATSTLYPVLLVLGKLYPAPGEADPQLKSFIPLLQKCAKSPIWKIRVLVAKALVPLISIENIVPILGSLFDSLPSPSTVNNCQNVTHGILLQILYILKECVQLPVSFKINFLEKLESWINKSYHLSLNINQCYTTRKAFLDIVLLSMLFGVLLETAPGKEIIENFFADLKSFSNKPDREHYLSLAVVVSVFHIQDTLLYPALYHSTDQNECNLFKYFLVPLFVDFLSCPHEVVRCTALQVLILISRSTVSSSNYSSLDTFVEPIFLEGLTLSCINRLIETDPVNFGNLQQDSQLSTHIMNMIFTENKNTPCFGKVCELSCNMPNVIENKWLFFSKTMICFEHEESDMFCKLEYLLYYLNVCKRDDVANQIFLLLSEVALTICLQYERECKNGNFEAIKEEEFLSVLEKWFQVLKRSSEPENCISRRKEVAYVLNKLCNCSMFNNSKIFGKHAMYLWEALLDLVMDDEPEIKYAAGNIVKTIKAIHKPDSLELPLVPTKAIEDMLDMFLKIDLYSVPDYIGIFINWMLRYEKNSFEYMGDEHPFDRGELNVFAEDLLLTRLASEKLSQYLKNKTDSIQDDLLMSVGKICCLKISCMGNYAWKRNYKTQEKITLDQVVSIIILDINIMLQNIQSRGATFFLLDNYLEQDILRICQRVYVLVCLWPRMKSPQSCVTEGFKLTEKIKTMDLNIYILNELVSKFLSYLPEQ